MSTESNLSNLDPSPTDLAHAGLKGLIGSVPVAGSVLSEIFGLYVAAPLEKRKAEFLAQIARDLDALETRVEGFSKRDLDGHTTFAPFVLGAVQAAMTAVEQEKLKLLRNAVLNVARNSTLHSDELQFFRELISSLTLAHVRVLSFLGAPNGLVTGERLQPQSLEQSAAAILMKIRPAVVADADFARFVVRDLMGKGLLAFPMVPPSSLGPGESNIYELTTTCLSPLGQRFMAFIADPLGT